MIHGQYQFGTVSTFLQHHLPQFQTHHQHTPKKSDTVLDTLKHDHNITALNIWSKVWRGALLGFMATVLRDFLGKADRKVLTDRSFNNYGRYILRKGKVNMALGALAGVGWHFLYHELLCPHGSGTFNRHLIAHAVAGSILWATLWNPGSFFYGALFGVIKGLHSEVHYLGGMPKDVEIQFGKVDQAARRRALHDERQLALSNKLLIVQPSLEKRFAV